jgi:hypothetical protein
MGSSSGADVGVAVTILAVRDFRKIQTTPLHYETESSQGIYSFRAA